MRRHRIKIYYRKQKQLSVPRLQRQNVHNRRLWRLSLWRRLSILLRQPRVDEAIMQFGGGGFVGRAVRALSDLARDEDLDLRGE